MSRIALLFVLVVSALSLRSEPSIARVDNVLRPGDPVRPLLVAGVLEKDCGTERDAKAFAAFANGASQELSAVKPCEFDDFTVQGMSGRWQMCMTPPPVYAAGTYNVTERFALMPVCATLVSERTQKAVLRLHSQTTPVLLNGRKVCDTSTLAYVGVERNRGKRDVRAWRPMAQQADGRFGGRFPRRQAAVGGGNEHGDVPAVRLWTADWNAFPPGTGLVRGAGTGDSAVPHVAFRARGHRT